MTDCTTPTAVLGFPLYRKVWLDGLYSAVAGDGRKRHQDVWTCCGQGKGSGSVVTGDDRKAKVSGFTVLVVRTRAQAVLLWQAVAKDANLPGDNLASVRSDTLIFIGVSQVGLIIYHT